MDEQIKLMERIKKLLELGKSKVNENEASSALAMAQKLADAYNIDIVTLGEQSGKIPRQDQRLKGGLYPYQRKLYKRVAELNHCMYWHEKGLNRGEKYRHRLLGSPINVMLANQMAEYLQEAVERITREDYCNGYAASYFRKDAHHFREGMIDRIVDRLEALQQEREREEKARRDEEAARNPGNGTSLVILDDVREREKIANYNYLNGEGAWEALEEAKLERARKRLEAEEAYAKWAEENPEEHAAKVKEKADADAKWYAEYEKRVAKAAKKEPKYRPMTAKERADSEKYYGSAYNSGRAAGDKVSLDRQIEETKNGGLLE